jgi:acetyltransferase-like isoleucine patch superfamily enzyme
MTAWQQRLYNVTNRVRTWRDYATAKLWAIQGAEIGSRVAVEPNCRVDRAWGITIGERSRLERGVWLKLVTDVARVQIGRFCYLGAGTELDISNGISIGDHTVIAPGCFITDHDHEMLANRRIDEQACREAPVRIGSDVWIGARVCILRGVTIGDGAVVGAGAVVKHDVSPYDVVAGVPAKTIGNRLSKVRH